MKNWFLSVVIVISYSCIQEPENNGLGGYISIEDEYNELNTFEDDWTDDLAETEFNENAVDTSLIDFINLAVDKLHNNKLKEFSRLFHPEKGCTFTPYTWTSKNSQNFKQEQFKELLDSTDLIMNWGVSDGKGDPIELTLKNYFKRFVYSFNFKDKSTDIHFNKDLAYSNTLNNIKNIHPNADFMEFYHEGTEEFTGMDWSSLIFYAEKYKNKYYLVAIAHNEWTI